MAEPAQYAPAPGVRWAVQSAGVLLIAGARAVELDYPEAALWDLVARATPSARVLDLVAAITRTSEQEAAGWVASTLGEWAARGFIVLREADRG